MNGWLDLCRLAHITAVVVRHLIMHLAGGSLSRWPWLARRLPEGTLPGPERLRMMFEEFGGTFIKLGQMLALQPDILPLAYCNALFELLDRITPFGYEAVEKTFMEQFGQRPTDIFDRFDPEPLATASIGQVYVAYLGDDKVAVKVQRPSVKDDFAGDIRLMSRMVRLIETLHLRKCYWMVEPLSEFVAWTREELDFRSEIRYLERLRNNARDNAKEYIPAVVRDYSTHCILTLEFLEVVYPVTTDNSSRSPCGKIASFHHPERRRHHDTGPLILPTPTGFAGVDLPPHSRLVARSSQDDTSNAA